MSNTNSNSRRPSRSSVKTVCYAAVGKGSASDSDDDFARDTPPPSKRTKTDKPSTKTKATARTRPSSKPSSREVKPVSSSESDCQNGSRKAINRVNRVSPDEKVFDRKMQLALELSRQESRESKTNGQTADKLPRQGGRRTEVEVQIHSPPSGPRLSTMSSENKENMVAVTTKPATVANPEPSDEIIVVETLDAEAAKAAAGGRRKRKAARDAVAKRREMSRVESDSDDDDDDDFGVEEDEGSGESSDGADSDYEVPVFASSKRKKAASAVGKAKSSPSEKEMKSGAKTTSLICRAKVTPTAGVKTTPTAGAKTTPTARAKTTPKAAKVVKSATPKASPIGVAPLARPPLTAGPVRGFTPPAATGVKTPPACQRAIASPGQRAIASPAPTPRRGSLSSPTCLNSSNPLGGVKLVSPGQPLRLGLSKSFRIKPLHPNPSVH